MANNVTYVNTCCGKKDSAASSVDIHIGFVWSTVIVILLVSL